MIGTIDCQNGSIVWIFGTRVVWLADATAIGRKRALYDFHKAHNSDAMRRIARLEANAKAEVATAHAEAIVMDAEIDRIDGYDDLVAACNELGIDPMGKPSPDWS